MPQQLELPLEVVRTGKIALEVLGRIFDLQNERDEIHAEIKERMEQHGINDLKQRLRTIRQELEAAEAEYRLETGEMFRQLISDNDQED